MGSAVIVGEVDGSEEDVGGRVLLPPPQTQQCSVAGPIDPANRSAIPQYS